MARRHLINSSDVFVIKGFTVHNLTNNGYFSWIFKIYLNKVWRQIFEITKIKTFRAHL